MNNRLDCDLQEIGNDLYSLSITHKTEFIEYTFNTLVNKYDLKLLQRIKNNINNDTQSYEIQSENGNITYKCDSLYFYDTYNILYEKLNLSDLLISNKNMIEDVIQKILEIYNRM